ncbi:MULTISPECIES: MFS transporter [unclassified Cellulophaga]|uniref:MFS transporter n=1 Tax=unclassified Cellulophaga TaxID=2634405 RepID=UPI0026E2102B|nr:MULTISPECIES: MFS transporter [unclassified Cellulophaga]MDO6492092.1 MFS transporter [Cellulophaga sp. 2_MG-2023]MDO6495747.1 MFS transporter [Cellulophaga sp. 3_MG-2023]
MTSIALVKGSKKLLNAWAFYDWANSVYSLVIASAIFPIFYGALFRAANIEKVTIFGGEIARAPLISYTTSLAFVFIAIITPLISGVADYLGNKRMFMKFFCYLGGVSCIGLYWFSLDNLYFGLLCFFMGLVGFWVSFAINNSYLPDVAHPEQMDAISAKGFSMGYAGSVILLLFNLLMVMKPEFFGIETDSEGIAELKAMKYSFVTVGIWWIIFSQYTFYYLPKGNKQEGDRKNVILNGFKELKGVWGQLGSQVKLKRYLIAFFVYSMAVQTVMLIATYFGEEEIAWGTDKERTTGLIVSILVIQIVAILGALVTAAASKKFGNVKTLVVVNILWVVICIYAFYMITPIDFYIGAGCVGLVMGGIQALSRSTYSKFLPDTKDTTSFFSFYDVAEKIGIVIGTFLYGFVAQVTGSMRNAIVFLAIFFIAGVVLLLRVDKK